MLIFKYSDMLFFVCFMQKAELFYKTILGCFCWTSVGHGMIKLKHGICLLKILKEFFYETHRNIIKIMKETLEGNQIWLYIVIWVIIVAVTILAICGLLRLNRFIFKRIQKKHEGLHLLFFQRLSSAIILIGGVIFVFSLFGGVDSVWKSLLGGTAIVSAVLAFAAQDVIKDILAGLMISIHKPFEVGNRIELEDGTTGIVKDMTMRHVVIRGIDSQYHVVPNSKLNLMKLSGKFARR